VNAVAAHAPTRRTVAADLLLPDAARTQFRAPEKPFNENGLRWPERAEAVA